MSGPIRDRQGEIIGYEDRDGTLRDKNKKKIGYLKKNNGTVFDSENQEVGFIDKEGTVVDRYRRRVGTIAPDGTVQDFHGVELYSGSAGPLLLDFENTSPEPAVVERLDFENYTREPHPELESKPPRVLLPEGFVSPSLLGCLGIIGAIIVGSAIIFLFQNPSLILGKKATPTASGLTVSTPRADNAPNTPAPSSGTAVPTVSQAGGKVNTQILNLRQGPATTFEIVDRLEQDTAVVITGRSEDSLWFKVNVPSISKDGWVSVQYIDTTVTLDSLPVVKAPAQ